MVVTNSPVGSFNGLINATIVGVVTEVLSRQNLFTISFRGARHGLRKLRYWLVLTSGCPFLSKAPPPSPQLNRIGRFKRVYLGVKVDTEYWGVFTLIVIKVLGWGFAGVSAPAMNHDTGELVDVLNCSWVVIGIIASGELASDVLSWLLGLLIRRFAPAELHVVVPVVTPTHAGVVVAMWMTVGALCLNGISSMGVLSDSLQS